MKKQDPQNVRCLTRIKIDEEGANPMEATVCLKPGQTYEVRIAALKVHLSCTLLPSDGTGKPARMAAAVETEAG